MPSRIQYCIKDAFQGTTGRYWFPEQQPILPTTTLLGKEGKETAKCPNDSLRSMSPQCPNLSVYLSFQQKVSDHVRSHAMWDQNVCKCRCRNKKQLTLKIVVREAKPTNSIKSTYSSFPIWGERQSVKQFQAHNLAQPCTTCWTIWPWLPWPEHLVELQPINLPPLDLLLALHSIRSSIKCSACCVFLHVLLCCDRVHALCMFDLFSAKFFQIGSYEPLTLADSICICIS